MADDHRSLDMLLDNILLWGERLDRFLAGRSKQEFGVDELRQAAASKCIEAIGEACGEILRRHADFAAAHSDLDLVQAYRTRNRLSHGYDRIDWEVLWDTAVIYVPRLLAEIRAIEDGADEP